MTTTDLAQFGSNGRLELIKLLTAWEEQALPLGFYADEVIPMMNINSGYVFLTNSDFQCAVLNGDSLELWYNCNNCGHEGFKEDCELTEDGCKECESK